MFEEGIVSVATAGPFIHHLASVVRMCSEGELRQTTCITRLLVSEIEYIPSLRPEFLSFFIQLTRASITCC